MLLDVRYVLRYSKNRIRYLLIATAADTIIDFQIFRYVVTCGISGVVDVAHGTCPPSTCWYPTGGGNR